MRVCYIAVLLLGIFFTACGNVAQVKLVGMKADSLKPEVHYLLMEAGGGNKGNDSLFMKEVLNSKGEFYRLTNYILFLKPGDQLTITSSDGKVTFSGDRAKENEWLNQSALRFQSLVSSVKRDAIAGMSFTDYKQVVEKDAQALRATLGAFSDKVFKANAEERIYFLEMDALLNYYTMARSEVYKKEKDAMMRSGEYRKQHYMESEKMLKVKVDGLVVDLKATVYPEVEKMLAATKGAANMNLTEGQQLFYKLALMNEEMLVRNGYEAFCEMVRVMDFRNKVKTQVFTARAGELELNTTDPYLKAIVTELCKDYQHLQPGKEATDCVLETIDGKTMKLSDLKGKPIVIDLWYVQCAPCREFMPVYDAVAKAYEKQGVTFVSISTDRKREDWIDFKSKHKSPQSMIQCRDGKGEFQKAYLVTSAPRVIMIDENFKIVNAQVLERKEEELKAVVDGILKK